MHYISTLLVFMTMMVLIHARSSSCPEEYRELRRRSDVSSSDSDEDQWREYLCDQAMDAIARQGDSIKNRFNLHTYCAYYDEASELARENNDTLCENKKRDLNMKRKRQQAKKKRDDDSTGSDDYDNDDDDDEKRRALRKRKLDKRLALRFIHKRLS